MYHLGIAGVHVRSAKLRMSGFGAGGGHLTPQQDFLLNNTIKRKVSKEILAMASLLAGLLVICP
jgi:hypothetical protein